MVAFIKKTFKKIKDKLLDGFDLSKALISCLIVFSAFMIVFPTGALSNKTIDEVCANHFVDISKNHTNFVGEKKLSGLVVEPKDAGKTKMRQDTASAITELWGVFKGSNASFAPTMNVNRDYDIFFSDESYSSESLSLVYTNVGQSTEPYHTVKDEKTGKTKIVDYKFQSSPIALMFSSKLSGMQDVLHIYISQAQAERKLNAMGKEINETNLRNLQKTPTEMVINGKSYNCIIDNIYLDNFEHSYKHADYDYYYATDIGTIIGDFVFVILYANKAGVFPVESELKRQSLYVMSEYSFRNRFYLEYAKEAYSYKDYSFDYVKTNLKSGFIPDSKILQNALEPEKSDAWSTLLAVVVVLFFVANLFFMCRFKLLKQPLSLLMILAASFIPYTFFKILFVATNNVFIFSSYSLIFTLILLVVLIFVITIINCFAREIKMEKKNV